MSWLEKKYIPILCRSFRNYKQKDNDLFNFSCPICNDSETNKYKARGYIYSKDGKFLYRCHNCGHGTTFTGLMKTTNPQMYREYMIEKYKDDGQEQRSVKEEPVKQAPKDLIRLEMVCDRIASMDDNSPPVKYLLDRKIPRDKFKDFFFTQDMNQLSRLFKKYNGKVFHKEPRIVIPIKDRQKKIVGIIARAINDSQLRYINMTHNETAPMIYNLDAVDFGKKIYITEGAFDSMFLTNSVAVDGADFQKIEPIIPKSNCVIIFDNQPRNVQLKPRIQRIANEGWNVCVWPSELEQKDINEMVCSGKTKEDIMKIIDENTFSGLVLKLKLSKWFKV